MDHRAGLGRFPRVSAKRDKSVQPKNLLKTGERTHESRLAMTRGGLRSTSFKRGVSGNPGGRPKKPSTIEARRIELDVKALARECAPEAISTLKTIMLDAKAPPAARIGAAAVILDRGYGKPQQAIDVTVKSLDFSKLTDEQLDQFHQLLMALDPDSEKLALPAPSLCDGEMCE